ncbi:DUF2637 domain-containing protein [Kitasatospora sp. NPDC007106]|uniref:DUF2637 domain-containing protein n=1 Tax=Kitasatospora sp. NPDC007106 TaxID=3156914 RepID=UPI0033DCFF4E
MSRWAKFWMVAGLLAVVGMAFRVSWNALRDVATAIGADVDAAFVYPLVVDGLMALALVAALVLPQADRRFALRVLAGYTAASLVLNYVHGLVPTLHTAGRARLADWAPAHWALVLLASSLPVGSIFFGSDLVAKVLHHKPELAESTQTVVNRSGSELREQAHPGPVESVYQSPDPTPAPAPTADPTPPAVEAAPVRPVRAVAAVTSRPRRATGTVPQSARTGRPTRTPEQLLAEARSATADWPDDQLTAERIRAAVRTSADRARTLRDALKAERAAGRPGLHAVPDTDDLPPAAEGPAPETGEGSEEQAS